MTRIVHLALKVETLEETTEFYQRVFGFREVRTQRVRDHVSRHLTDGAIDFTLIQYDAGTTSAESQASGQGPCIHHFAIEVDDVAKYVAEITQHGCEIITAPGEIPVKFRAPGGTVAELVPVGRYRKSASG
jgi:lactoylglutathione lyase